MQKDPDPGEVEGARRLLSEHGPRLAAEARVVLDMDSTKRPAGLILTPEVRRQGIVQVGTGEGQPDDVKLPLDAVLAVLVTRATLREGIMAQKRPELLAWLANLEETQLDHLPVMIMTRNGLMCGAFEMPPSERDPSAN